MEYDLRDILRQCAEIRRKGDNTNDDIWQHVLEIEVKTTELLKTIERERGK